MNFAKLYNLDITGQTLVTKEDEDGEPVIEMRFFLPEGDEPKVYVIKFIRGTGFTLEEATKVRDETFDKLDEQSVLTMVSRILYHTAPENLTGVH